MIVFDRNPIKSDLFRVFFSSFGHSMISFHQHTQPIAIKTQRYVSSIFYGQ